MTEAAEALADFRAHEQAVLLDALDAARGSVLLVHGPRGVGKARLAAHLEREAAARADVAVVSARCPPAGAQSFHPFAEIARQLMAWADRRGLTETLVDPLVPLLAPVIERGGSPAAATPSLEQRLAFFDGCLRFFRGVATHGRLCAVVHDLERADADTLELAAYLADELFEDGDTGRGVLVLLARPNESPEGRVRDFIAEFEARPGAKVLALEGLDLEGLRRYVQSPHLLEKLLAASCGLPQAVDALIAGLPTNVEELFERRMRTLSPLARSLLSALSVSARPASARQLSEVTGAPSRDVAQALSGLRADRIIERRIEHGELQFSFVRRRDLEVALRSAGAEEQAVLHGRWASSLAADRDADGQALVAYHQLRSDEPSLGVPLAVEAAERHAVAGAIHAALELLEDALPHAEANQRLAVLGRLADLAPLTGNPARALRYVDRWKAELPPERRAVALLREAELHNAAGNHQLALEAVEIARSGPAPDRARLEGCAAEALYQLGRHAEAEAAVQRALGQLGENPDEIRFRIDLENQLGKVQLARGAVDEAVRSFEATLAAAEHHGLAAEGARALVNLGLVRVRRGELGPAEAALGAGIEKAKEAGDLVRLAFGHLNLGTLHHQSGALGSALVQYRECRSLFRRLGQRTQLARVLTNLGNLYLLCGDLGRARQTLDEALHLAKMSSAERVVALATVVDGALLAAEGHIDAAEARLREGALLQQTSGAERPVEAMLELCDVARRAGRLDRARAALEEAKASLDGVDSPVLGARIRCLAAALDPAKGTAELELAREVFVRFSRRLGERDAELNLARALHAEGRPEMARVRLEAARRLQVGVAKGLPERLAGRFLAAAPQAEVEALALEIENPTTFQPPVQAPVPIRADARAPADGRAPAEQRPADRAPEWEARYGAIVGRSPKLLRVFRILDRIASSEGTVLVVGESGTGKELVAEAIHRNSTRARGPFVKLNCAALVESLLLSELFGHERGSFTGAHQRKIGRFEMAAGGTLFLDEIGDISQKTQVSLLRVLQEREFERVGGGQTLKLDARLVFATNKNLAEMVREGTFREDLYYRLKGITVELPPLRERPEDILALAEHFLDHFAQESGEEALRIDREAEALLVRYGWPGNIRELENVLRSVALFAEGPVLRARDFDEYGDLFRSEVLGRWPPEFSSGELGSGPADLGSGPADLGSGPAYIGSAAVRAERPLVSPNGPRPVEVVPAPAALDVLGKVFDEGLPLPELKRQIQVEAIARALRRTEGNITRAAEMLGMRRPRLSQIINADESLKRLAQGTQR